MKLAVLAAAMFLAPCAMAADASKAACDSLALVRVEQTKFKPTFISSEEAFTAIFAGVRPATAPLPFCRVEMIITPAVGAEIRSELWLPAVEKWNKRFLAGGTAGAAGMIDRTVLADGVAKGYATTTSDAGSHATGIFKMDFGRNPEWAANRAYRGVHLTAVAAKLLVQSYYEEKPKAAMFMGCSGGGYEAMSLIQRYPEDYDGLVIGDPAIEWEKLGLWQGSAYVASHKDPAAAIPAEKLPLITKAAVAKCDALDGVTDGVIDDPRQCKLDFTTLLCKAGDGPDCFTAPQVAALTEIYTPFVHPHTKAFIYPGFNLGSETGFGAPARLAGDSFGSTVSAAQPGPLVWSFPEGWKAVDWLRFDFDKGIDAAIKAYAPFSNSDPDIRKFKERGGKVIMYTGWADPNVNPETLVRYYEQMTKVVGGRKDAESFARLFVAPGLNHCSGGPGPNAFGQLLVNTVGKIDAENNILLALDRWVVDGVAPDKIIATKYLNDDLKNPVQRTRPVCAYPKVARWNGSGSTDEAANFACVDLRN